MPEAMFLSRIRIFRPRLMHFHNIDTLIQAILDCVEQHIDGRNVKTRQRREAIVAFFDRNVVLSGSEMPNIETLLENVLTVLELFLAALESAPMHQLNTEVRYQLVSCVNALYRVIPSLKQPDSEEFVVNVSASCLKALQSVFDWTEPARLQAYVFARTGEFMGEGLLGKERSQLMVQVRSCAEELKQ
jgi:hypothetical protein